MLHSFCIKTNNCTILEKILFNLEETDLKELYITNREFKIYKNVIAHYNGEDVLGFYALLAGAVTEVIVNFYENILVKKLLVTNYFYFSKPDLNEILYYCNELLKDSQKEKMRRYSIIFSACFDYIKENRYLILEGFIKFRLKEYISELDEIVNLAVDRFVLDKEYNEFTSLLKLYVNSKEPEMDTIHLIYHSNESILLDNDKNAIDISSSIFDAKYLSDISFSSNDYALNALLNLLPEKIYMHLIDEQRDEFVETIELIFGNRVIICKDCSICSMYRIACNNKKKNFSND